MLNELYGRHLTKPGLGVQIDWGHPLAIGLTGCWILNEGARQPFDLVSRTLAADSPESLTSWKWSSGPRVGVLETTAASSTPLRLVPGTVLPVKGPFSIAMRYRKTDATNRASAAFGTDAGEVGDSFKQCGAHVPYSDGKVYWDFSDISVGRLSYTPASVADNSWVFTTGPAGMAIYRNGVLEASNSLNPTRDACAATDYLHLGKHNSISSDLAQWNYFYIFNRQFTAAEAAWLYEEPYAFLLQPTYRRWGWVKSYPVAYLMESGTEYYLLEDGSGVYLMEQEDATSPATLHVTYDKRPPYLGPILAQ